jgi:hypothetical protein
MSKEIGRVITLENNNEQTSGIGDLVVDGSSFVEITKKDGSKQKGKMLRFSHVIYFQDQKDTIKNVFIGGEEAICMEVRELAGKERIQIEALFIEKAKKN